MKGCFMTILLLLMTVSALAGPGRDIDVLYFDLGSGDNCASLSPGDTFTATVCLWGGLHAGAGTIGVAFMLNRTFGGEVLDYWGMLGGVQYGGPDDISNGWIIEAGPDCVPPNSDGFIPVAGVEYLYLGPPGYVEFLPNPIMGMLFLDCANVGRSWHHRLYPGGNLGINMDPPNGCANVVPAEKSSWGTIKALYG